MTGSGDRLECRELFLALCLLPLKQIPFFFGCFFVAVSVENLAASRRSPQAEVVCFPRTTFEARARALFTVSTFSQCASWHSKLGKKPRIFWNLRTPLLVKCANHGCTFVNYFFESRFSEFSVLTVHDGWSV